MSVTKRHEPYRTLIEPPRPAANERRLWIAVLEAAYADDKAAPWFADNTIATGTFLWVCEILDLDPEVMRRPLAVMIPVVGAQWRSVRHRPIG